MDPSIQEALLSPPVLALLGLCIGSFLNVVIHRLPQMLERGWKIDSAEMLGLDPAKATALGEPVNLSRPRSRCPSCGHAIAWHENIPLLSYLRLGGKCSACKTRISPRYPLVELLTAVLFAAIGWRFGPQPVALLWCGLVALLVALAGIDWDTTLLPDNLTLPLLWAGLVASALGWTVPLPQAVWGAVAGYLSLWSVYWMFKLATGKEGMGHGDFKLLGALGAWLGWKMLPLIVLGSSVVGACIGISLVVLKGRDHNIPLAFGPYLAIAGMIALFWGPPLARVYFPN
jgi:leader peptidase (prepilin peptidase)/N-methyltransferase